MRILLALIIFIPQIRPTDIDSKGHVNHIKQLEYLEAARWKALNTEEKLVVVHLEINYRNQLKYGEEAKIVTEVYVEGDKKIVFDQKILRGETIVSEARVIMLTIVNDKSISVPQKLRERIESLSLRP